MNRWIKTKTEINSSLGPAINYISRKEPTSTSNGNLLLLELLSSNNDKDQSIEDFLTLLLCYLNSFLCRFRPALWVYLGKTCFIHWGESWKNPSKPASHQEGEYICTTFMWPQASLSRQKILYLSEGTSEKHWSADSLPLQISYFIAMIGSPSRRWNRAYHLKIFYLECLVSVYACTGDCHLW